MLKPACQKIWSFGTPSSPCVLPWLLPGQQGQQEQRLKDYSDLEPADHTPLKNQSYH